VFENLLAQDDIRDRLKSDIRADRLPPTLLFTGAPGSGKMTAALELARALSCARDADWNCACPSCSRHRVLAHPDTLLLGARSFPEEIQAAEQMLGKSWTKTSLYFFMRAARKLLRRFDPVLFTGEETRLSKASPLVREIEEDLGLLGPESMREKPDAPAMKALAGVAAACAKLEAFVPDMPPIFMVRNVESWSRLAPFGRRKTVIIENADRMQDSARNALLKILEEPPETVRFALSTSRRGAVLATILSRSRTYPFATRTPAQTKLVISRIFHSEESCASVEEFLAARRSFTPAAAGALARDFLGATLFALSSTHRLDVPMAELASSFESGEPGHGSAVLASILDATGDFGAKDESFASSFETFIGALQRRLSDLLADPRSGPDSLRLVAAWATLLRDALVQKKFYNRSPSLLAQTVMYAMEAVQ
jgi:DNA polymerase-3 subunit gamma/tau